MTLDTTTLGGGCFWCLEAVFRRLAGVSSVVSGYAGGHTPNPTYKEVCTGETGHAEVIQIEYNPKTISYKDLLSVFWQTHDPTTLNRQGNDTGTQYRSVIMPHNEQQNEIAIESISEWSLKFNDQIVTSIEQYADFHPAEEYHQEYYEHNREAVYCTLSIRPKIDLLEQKSVLPSKNQGFRHHS